MRNSRTLRILTVICLTLGAITGYTRLSFAAENRVALVIGNSAYPSARLRNPVNDANAMAAKLRTLGFDVILRTDASQRDMSRAISEFGKKLRLGSIGLFYFAGHGVQVRGKNFLIPVDAEIENEASVRGESVDVDQVLDQLGPAQLSVIILDACRNNPFEARFRRVGGGLAQIDAPTGSILAYATAPGRVAADGAGANGTYTAALLNAMDVPGLKVEDVFKQVRNEVLRESDNQQIPWESSSLTTEFYFRTGTKAQVENAMLRQSESERAELLKEMAKLRAALLAMTSIATVGTTSTPAKEPLAEPVVAGLPPAQDKGGQSVAKALSTAWSNRVAILEKSRGKLTLTSAIAILLDMATDDELGPLLLHEEQISRKSWHNAYAMGTDENGNLVWGGAFQMRNSTWAAETAIEHCASGLRKTCKSVIVNGEFREKEFLEMVTGLGAKDIAATRASFVASLAKRPVEVRVGLSSVAGGGTADFHYAFGYSSVRN